MRKIKQTSQFKRDLKRELKGVHRQSLQTHFLSLVEALASGQPLDSKY